MARCEALIAGGQTSILGMFRDSIRSCSNCPSPHHASPFPRARTVPYLESEDRLRRTAWGCICSEPAIVVAISAGWGRIDPELWIERWRTHCTTAHEDRMHCSKLLYIVRNGLRPFSCATTYLCEESPLYVLGWRHSLGAEILCTLVVPYAVRLPR